ncbi:MAG: helix-turn-helix domain-containing protein [Anaerolineales bacterium]|nr:helix-turn-helix domain-containing protein [Anaerolineales bacterium]
MKRESDSLSPAVERALSLLEAVREQPRGVTLADLLARLDISRSSLFVLLNTLKALGYLEQTEKRGRYRAGPRLLAWQSGASPLPAAELLPAFFQEAEALHPEETLALFAATPGGEAWLLGQVEGRREVRSVFEVGQRLPPSSAPGRLFQSPLLAEIPAQGYAVTRRGDAVDVAFPVCRDGVSPIAALVWSLPAFRWNEVEAPKSLSPVREMAARLSYRLGALHYSPWQTGSAETQETLPLDKAQMTALLRAPWTARLACVRPDGAPHVVPVWHEWDGEAFHVPAWKGSRWGEYLRLNPQVSLTVDEPFLPLRRVSAKGIAQPEFDAGDPRLKHLLKRLSRRYLGRSLAASLALPVERSFLIVPSSLKGWQGLT